MTFEHDAEKETKDVAALIGSEPVAAARRAFAEGVDVSGGINGRIRAEVRGIAHGVQGSVGDALTSGHQAVRSGGVQVARRVARQPLEALSLACAVGYLAGWAISRS